MAVTWTGWIDDILHAINAPTQPNNPPPGGVGDNPLFLASWYNSEDPLCDFNPLVAYYAGSNTTNCKALPNGHHAQNYTSTAQAVARTKAQFESGDYPTLLKALRDNNIYAQKVWSGVALNLERWGAVKAQAEYNYFMVNTYGQQGPGSGPGPPPPKPGTFAPHSQHGWNELRQALNHRLHGQLSHTNASLRAALRELHR